jgi:hypothetical protein
MAFDDGDVNTLIDDLTLGSDHRNELIDGF